VDPSSIIVYIQALVKPEVPTRFLAVANSVAKSTEAS